MKILTIQGSLRRNGNTHQAVDLVTEQLRQIAAQAGEPLEIEQVALRQVEIHSCRGCRACFDRGEEKCPEHDDMAAIRAKMLAADAVLLASPIYVDDVNGATKTWIDRLAHACHRPLFAGKCAYALATVAASPTSHALQTMTMALRTWGFHIVGQDGWKMGALMQREASQTAFEARARKIAMQLFRAVKEQQYRKPSFFSLMMFAIQQKAWRGQLPGTLDYQYWHQQGWIDPKCTFYIPHHANAIKVGLARMVGAVIFKFVA